MSCFLFCSILRYNFFRLMNRQFLITIKFHREISSGLGHRTKCDCIIKQLRLRGFCHYLLYATGLRFHTEYFPSSLVHIPHNITHVVIRDKYFYMHDWLQQTRFRFHNTLLNARDAAILKAISFESTSWYEPSYKTAFTPTTLRPASGPFSVHSLSPFSTAGT